MRLRTSSWQGRDNQGWRPGRALTSADWGWWAPVRDLRVMIPASGRELGQMTFSAPLSLQSHCIKLSRSSVPSGIIIRHLWNEQRHPRTAYVIILLFQIWRQHDSLGSEPARDVSGHNFPTAAKFIPKSSISRLWVCFWRWCDRLQEVGTPRAMPSLSRSRDGTIPAINGAL